MQSPFPGMDPFLEADWRDVHARLILYISNQLQPMLPPGLKARVEQRVFLEWPDHTVTPRYPDVRIFEHPASGYRRGPATTTLEPAVPKLVEMPWDPIEESQLQIIDTHAGNRVVTCIEVLSPPDKTPGSGQESYKSKRGELLCAGSSFVEIDLIRRGQYSLFPDLKRLEPEGLGYYNVCVTRAHAYGTRSELYPIGLWERLPVIRTPLRDSDEDVLLDLQTALDEAYVTGAYEDLDYHQPLDPPLSAEDRLRLNSQLERRA